MNKVKKIEKSKKRIAVTLEKKQIEEIERVAKDYNIKKSTVVNLLISKYLEKEFSKKV